MKIRTALVTALALGAFTASAYAACPGVSHSADGKSMTPITTASGNTVQPADKG